MRSCRWHQWPIICLCSLPEMKKQSKKVAEFCVSVDDVQCKGSGGKRQGIIQNLYSFGPGWSSLTHVLALAVVMQLVCNLESSGRGLCPCIVRWSKVSFWVEGRSSFSSGARLLFLLLWGPLWQGGQMQPPSSLWIPGWWQFFLPLLQSQDRKGAYPCTRAAMGGEGMRL